MIPLHISEIRFNATYNQCNLTIINICIYDIATNGLN
jgi:hypothetical protein